MYPGDIESLCFGFLLEDASVQICFVVLYKFALQV
jgi:hypothetical protein